jgi:hypothetical protein
LRRVPLFRSKSHLQLPAIRLGPLAIIVVLCLVAGGLMALAVFEPRPPLKHFEVPVPNERLAR